MWLPGIRQHETRWRPLEATGGIIAASCGEETQQTEARTGRAGGDSRKSLVLLISMPNAQLQRKLEIHSACTRMGMAVLEGSFSDDAAQGSGTCVKDRTGKLSNMNKY
ncbi:hypothetical protein CMUS01_07169 [Colletotrichum musicola]|uniref:Uncharacterized protein n=1 Tax=Colletotrichum musicola TaxID=2175873 RepID=A0A8H6KIX2_9PEZI|nr:hypothetical protein CMUS01_07169 [Colletotrichum musicola]